MDVDELFGSLDETPEEHNNRVGATDAPSTSVNPMRAVSLFDPVIFVVSRELG